MSDVYQLVTEKITAALEAGTVPWQKPWSTLGPPRNLVSRRPYRGVNLLLLSLGSTYNSPWWLTFKQAKDRGGHVKQGEKASLVTFWKVGEIRGDEEESGEGEEPRGRRVPIL